MEIRRFLKVAQMANFRPFRKGGWDGRKASKKFQNRLTFWLAFGRLKNYSSFDSKYTLAKMPNGREITRFLEDLTYIGTSSVVVCNDCTITHNIFTSIPANSLYLHFSWLRAMSLTSNILKFPATFKHFRWYLNVCQALLKNSEDFLFISKLPMLGICKTRRGNSVLLGLNIGNEVYWLKIEYHRNDSKEGLKH